MARFLGRVVRYGKNGSQMNQHPYVAIAYDEPSDAYLFVNFTTKRGSITPIYTIDVSNTEFPAILESPISQLRYEDAEELTASQIVGIGVKKDHYGKEIVCPKSLMKRIIDKITTGSKLTEKLRKKFFV